MKLHALLVSLMAAAAAAAACCSYDCDGSCRYAKEQPGRHFKHLMTDLQNTSVAPWSYRNSSEEGRLPETIHFAVCAACSLDNMEARSISLLVPVFKRHRSLKGWCKCRYELAVGCTCVRKQ